MQVELRRQACQKLPGKVVQFRFANGKQRCWAQPTMSEAIFKQLAHCLAHHIRGGLCDLDFEQMPVAFRCLRNGVGKPAGTGRVLGPDLLGGVL